MNEMPVLDFKGKEDYELNGVAFTRFMLEISNYEKIFDLSPLDKGFVLIDPDMAVNAHKQILKEIIQPTA